MFSFFNSLKKEKASADIAKERLSIVIASNRKKSSRLPYLKDLEDEIMQVIKKYIEIEDKDMEVRVDTDEKTGLEVLEVNVSLPDGDELSMKK